MTPFECIKVDLSVPGMRFLGFDTEVVHKQLYYLSSRTSEAPLARPSVQLFLTPRMAEVPKSKRRSVMIRQIMPMGTYHVLPVDASGVKDPRKKTSEPVLRMEERGSGLDVPVFPRSVRLSDLTRRIRHKHPDQKRIILVVNGCRNYGPQMMQVQNPQQHPMQIPEPGIVDLVGRMHM